MLPWDDDEVSIVLAAMIAMTRDIHALQDNLTPEQWERAEAMTAALEAEANERMGFQEAT